MPTFSLLRCGRPLLLTLTLLLGSLLPALAQTTSVGIGTTAPNAKAALEIAASDKGLLIPRLTAADRGLIGAPIPAGLLVYQTDGAQPGFWYYEASGGWTFLNPVGVPDNLGNHTATQALNLGANQLVGNGGTNGLAVSSAGNVGIGGVAPASAALAVTSTTQGFLPPRVTQTQRDAIGAPATGLQLYNTTTSKLNSWNGTSWEASLSTTEQPYQAPIATFIYTGGPQTYTVPAGVTSVVVRATGASGGVSTASTAAPGQGAVVTATLAVTPGQVYTVNVGGVGGFSTSPPGVAGGYNGGGSVAVYGGAGGGASDLRLGGTALTDRVLVAGGGGGGAYSVLGNGGNGGTPNGGNGLAGSGGVSTGGSQSGPGSAGGASLGQGGSTTTFNYGGGGGGGYYGGGANNQYSGGGGGSSWVAAGAGGVSYAVAAGTGNGVVDITPVPVFAAPALSGVNFVNVPGDNLGNHTATQPLNLGANKLVGTGGTGLGIGNTGAVSFDGAITAAGAATIGGTMGVGTSPVASAQLEVASTTKGFLPPRLTETQRDAIAAPALGLTIYNTNTNKLNFWNGTSWTTYLGTAETSTTYPAVTFAYTGAAQTYTVPAGVNYLSVDAVGGQGGAAGFISPPNLGGKGGRTRATLHVVPGEVLTINVGGLGQTIPSSGGVPSPGGFNGGGAGYNGSGGGGGATDIRRGAATLADRLLVAAGGGGQAQPVQYGNGAGGGGGGLVGQDAGVSANLQPKWGRGGTQSAGGQQSGALGQGGAATAFGAGTVGNAGGGGGYYGGGAGFGTAFTEETYGGGGGSSYVSPTGSSAITYATGFGTGNGTLTLTPSALAAPVLDGSNIVDVPGTWSVSGANVYRSSGNVGIGTSSPTQALDVRGNLRLGNDGGNTTGTGQAVEFVGPGLNTDPVGLYRVNTAADASELRVVVGDVADANDKFSVGRNTATGEGGIPAGTFTPSFTVKSDGAVGIAGLAGTGTRMVTADLNGNLSTAAVPTDAQALTKSGSTISLTNGGAVTDSDNQSLSISGQTLSLTSGGSVTLPGDDLGSHTATTNLNLGANKLVGNGGTAGLNITATGNVGIGTTGAAGQKLEVAGSVYAKGEGTGFLTDNGASARVGLIKYSGREGGIWRTSAQDFEIGRVDAGVTALPGSPTTWTTDLYVGSTGNVGIGTTNPGVPLDVQTSNTNYTVINYGYLNGSGGTGFGGNSGAVSVSIRAAGRIVASEFNAVSDRRLKHVVGLSDRATDLALLNRLRITDYTMRDRVQFGDQPFKKVIAQEVEAVFPQAVHQQVGFLPDVYVTATRVEPQPGDSLLTLTLPACLPEGGATAGQRIKLIGASGEVTARVARPAAAGSRTLVVRGAQRLAAGPVFVYGLEHADVRAVDYEALSMLNVSATQELARQVAELQTKNAALQTQAGADHAALQTLQEQMARLLGEAPPASQARK